MFAGQIGYDFICYAQHDKVTDCSENTLTLHCSRGGGAVVPGHSTLGDAKQHHQKHFTTNDHKSEFHKVC